MSIDSEQAWISRNWKWAIPGGCLGLLVLTGVLVALVMGAVMSMFRQTEVYSHAMGEARANAEVVAAIGTPIREGWFMGGTLEVTPASGDADLWIPLEGPRGAAKLYVVATKSAGQWRYTTIVVELADGTRIDLLP